MNETLDWDDIRLFLVVAREGGLANAVSVTKVSAPTLGRRMTSLEHILGTRLFVRHRAGYDLTSAGRELVRLAEGLEQGALDIERWRLAATPKATVRIAAGAWMSTFLARHIGGVIEHGDGVAVEIMASAAPADLLRREANLGFRNRRPEARGLAGRRLASVAFAVYGAAEFVEAASVVGGDRLFDQSRWISFTPPGPKVPSAIWQDQRLRSEPILTCSTTQAVLEAAKGGVGLCVLPCFIGDTEPGLMRVSESIAELEHDQWLVSHDDDRHNKPIRRVAARLAELVRTHASLFRGDECRALR